MKIGAEARYEGMEWLKCDLQMQTPADRKHWRGDPLGDGEHALRAAATAYINRCYDVGLHVIGITDHNFASKPFIPYLRKAIEEQAPARGYALFLFPGFEIKADVGMGVHVLALFEPDTNLETIDHVLTECGITHPRFHDDGTPRCSTKRLPEILACVQAGIPEGRAPGVVILPHSLSNAGLFDNDQISEWLQKEEFRNPDLLCIEVPKPPIKMSKGFQRLFLNGDDCDPSWKRPRPIACIMSSDCYSLTPENPVNFIGYRYTWMKMSRPSIESMRQAFLDPASRINLPQDFKTDVSPATRQKHARILRLSIKGAAFVADQTLVFSRNLNCIIGGRGSGKSTLLEYMRLGLRRERDGEAGRQGAGPAYTQDAAGRIRGSSAVAQRRSG